MGDAAHPVSPAGGQGANMSVADAAAIAEVALRGESGLIDEYERRRRPANQRAMRPTRIGHFMLGQFPPPTPVVAAMLRRLAARPSIVARGVRAVAGAFREAR